MVISNWNIEEHIEVPGERTVYTAMSVEEFISKKRIACQHDKDQPCYCDKMLIHCGKDESIYKSNNLSSKCWTCDGEMPLRPKNDGLGVMVSAFVTEQDGFGLYMDTNEQQEYGQWRIEKGLRLLNLVSPAHAGVLFLDYGSSRDGYFDAAKLKIQLEDVLDFFEWKYTDKDSTQMTRQILVEFDHSSGHAKRDDGAVVPSELRKFTYTREDEDYPKNIPVTAEGLGEYCYAENGTLIEGKLEAGGEQTFTFAPTEGPFDLQDPAEKSKWAPGYPEGEGPTLFEGKGKGLRDLVWERGLMSDEAIAGASLAQLKEKFLGCADVRNQKSLLEKVVYDRGHVLILSPKYHPELAGVGIEYCWGQSKYRFRNEYNDQEAKNLKANVKKTFHPTQLTPAVTLAYARKTRDYRMTYKTIMTENIGTVNVNKGNIEKIRKNHKCHRNILDQEIGFIRNVIKEENIEHDVPGV